MLFPPRFRAYCIKFFIDTLCLRSGRISVGTWNVAPPIRRLFTSTCGVMLSNACFQIYGVQSFVEDFVRCIFLSIVHQVIDKLRYILVIEDWIWQDHTLLWFCFSHFYLIKNCVCGGCYCFDLQHSLLSIYSTLIIILQQNDKYYFNGIKKRF